jgi:hypothetical protein
VVAPVDTAAVAALAVAIVCAVTSQAVAAVTDATGLQATSFSIVGYGLLDNPSMMMVCQGMLMALMLWLNLVI